MVCVRAVGRGVLRMGASKCRDRPLNPVTEHPEAFRALKDSVEEGSWVQRGWLYSTGEAGW